MKAFAKTKCVGHHYVPVKDVPPKLVHVPKKQGTTNNPGPVKLVKLCKVKCPHCGKVKWLERW